MKLVGILTLAAAAVVVASPVMAQQDTTHKTVAVAKKAAKKENLKALTKITKDSATKVALAQVAAGSKVRASELEREKGVILQEIGAVEGTPAK